MIPYPAYKTTNLPWLPKIPEHWSRLRYKDVLLPKDIRVGNDTTYTLLSLTKQGVIIRDISEGKGKFPKDFDSYKVVEKNNFILCLFDVDETPRTVGVANDNGMITGAYDIFRVRRCNLQWLYYHYLALDDRKSLKSLYRGLRKTIPLPSLLSSHIYLPPIAEQEQIVRYLDAMTAKINKLIRAKKKQIALLQEQRQAIINQAVTKGLDPNAEMKDSGIDWLGKIPNHWTVNKVGHFYRSILGKMLASSQTDSTYTYEKYLCAKDVHFSGVDLSDLKEMWFSPEEKWKYRIKAGDLLVVEGGAGAGGAAVFMGSEGELYIQNSIHRIRTKSKKVSVHFLYYWLYALVGRKYIDYACNKATIPHFTGDKLFEMPFVLVPISEQNAIVNHLDEVCRKYDSVIDKLKGEIDLANEYKNSLISSVVTGQIDVRNIPVEDVIPDEFIAEDDPTNEIEEEFSNESEE